jgi:AraC-like DNA-binding protein
VPIRRTALHLERLLADGWTLEKIAVEADCSPATLQRVLAAHRRAPPGCVEHDLGRDVRDRDIFDLIALTGSLFPRNHRRRPRS